MSRIRIDEVRKVATLARLDLAQEELERYRGQLDAILDYMAAIGELDLTGVEPTFQGVPMAAPLRADQPQPSLARDEALRAAPATEANGFAVQKVMEGES